MTDYEPLNITKSFNSAIEVYGGRDVPSPGKHIFHGLPFKLGTPNNRGNICIKLDKNTLSTEMKTQISRIYNKVNEFVHWNQSFISNDIGQMSDNDLNKSIIVSVIPFVIYSLNFS